MPHVPIGLLQMHNLRILFCSALAVSLVGCANPGKPTASKVTDKTPSEYVACLLPKWQAVAPLTTQKSISHGYRLTAPSAVTSDEVLEVVEYRKGSRATFYKGSFLSSDKLRQAARDCLE
ncbi:hypothetical protein ACU5P1_11970 [Pseudomonas plecoglossicida]|uniref:Lipoprotein n=1 Tax=Pseudomonas plecoglossicida TaxID=70775 RepID=A0AAD0QU88_PSEDL|nr:hypothetical protein [Pseudomonas plecoglossicida]AXM94746.1 hypothetical protein DVB73_02335 [Pseudomonas plecoglossicida]QLB55487.1 hypothetical protein HAV28_11875 [Pseudomonas plecoglossicida]GLR35831.1 hypothetical protein GCM10011247_12280 [Pseudomonas plecoglossicida]